MPINLASPGILIREVDLTIGNVDPTTGKIGGIVGPFEKGPVGDPTLISSEKDLVDTFGRPYDTDNQYESWMTASSYLSYGGVLSVVRADDDGLKNAFSGTGDSIKIKSTNDYEDLGYNDNVITEKTVIARDPGLQYEDIRVAIIDSLADQILNGVSVSSPGGTGSPILVGAGITQAVPNNTVISKTGVGAGTTELLDGFFKGIVTDVDSVNDEISVKFLSHVSSAGTETAQDFNNIYKFKAGVNIGIVSTTQTTPYAFTTVTSALTWFDEQEYEVTTATVGGATTVTKTKWNTTADAPGTSEYASARGSRFDEVHIVVIDAKGTVTGNAGTILEKHLNLSKAKDAEFSAGSPQYWRKYLYNNSEYIYGGTGAVIGVTTTGFKDSFNKFPDGGWDQDTDGIVFNASGRQNLILKNGKSYGGISTITVSGALEPGLDDIIGGYSLFENDSEVNVDFLIQGSGHRGQDKTRALGEKLIATAELRKDAVAFLSPSRDRLLSYDANENTPGAPLAVDTITENIVNYYGPISSSSYAVFDSGYKYMYDRFNNTFRYVPLNGDIAGLCARNDINNFPWFSPAGTARGTILNSVKLAYNPTKLQRDLLYSNRINPVIFSSGSGIILFGDKTGFAKRSAFDRINVRRLFIFIENAIAAAAKDQLFEFNDEITRSNFVNIVEPFLRDVQAKRGIQDYVVICDETNNTAAIIDSNEFVADIFVKPARSINFIGLTFVATRTGVSFDEVIGSV
tara:strand:+ start:1829 stop:4054 length:2226 start_codon:yes stop_codon:yes gene_type:complete